MDTLNNHIFDFLPEISKNSTYRLLYPDPKAGLAVIWLYERIRSGSLANNSFKEKDIHEALKAVNPGIEEDRSRQPRSIYNGIVADLQEYFLRYDEDRQEYSFKEYAYIFCRQAHDILKANFSPTHIEKICYALHKKLERCEDLDFLLNWFKIDFDAFSPQLKRQLDFLDRQIDQSVTSLRENKRLNLQEGDILETLKVIDDRFETIRGQNKELGSAFREIDSMRRIMEESVEKYDNDEIDALVHTAVTFFQEMRRTLGIIDKRLDRIQPKIKQLFANLNKPLFNTRVERFLTHLIEHSIERVDGSKRNIQFPGSIPPLSIYTLPQNLVIVERKNDLFPIRPQKRVVMSESPEARAKAFTSFHRKLNQQDEVIQWIDKIRKALEAESQVDLSNYFFEIAEDKQEHSFTLAVMVIYRAVTIFERQEKYQVIVDSNTIKTNPLFKTTLWKIMIVKKASTFIPS